jgi:hypothetical protein
VRITRGIFTGELALYDGMRPHASECCCAYSAVSNYRPAMSCRSECFPSTFRMRSLDECCDHGSLCAFNCSCRRSDCRTRFCILGTALQGITTIKSVSSPVSVLNS